MKKNKLKKSPADFLKSSIIKDLKEDEAGEPSYRKIDFSDEGKTSEVPRISIEDVDNDKTNLIANSTNNTGIIAAEPTNLNAVSDDNKTVLIHRDGGPKLGLVANNANASNESKSPTHYKSEAASNKAEVKITFGAPKSGVKGTPYDAQLVQAENLKLAQSRIIELEKELEKLRKENELLSSAGEMTKQKLEEATGRIHQFEKQKSDRQTQFENEVRIFKDGLSQKDYENQKLRLKVEELEGRISADLRKIRVRERELENRLELLKAEKTALVRSKDETILDLKRKIDSVQVEIENYKSKVIELNQKIESNQEQFNRTIRTLRLALTNLEVNDPTISSSNVGASGPFKKAE